VGEAGCRLLLSCAGWVVFSSQDSIKWIQLFMQKLDVRVTLLGKLPACKPRCHAASNVLQQCLGPKPMLWL
jgi:hypothetical protein